MNDTTKTFTSPTIFGLLSAQNLPWAIYGYDAQPLTRLDFPDVAHASAEHFGKFADFQKAAAAGTLGAYTFLEPSWESTGNSQHPNYNVALGEQLIHDVYYALRNGPAWNETLLIITYDEHGGCYDHVPPPLGAVPPDKSAGEYGFDFKRFGVRVPTVLVSPLIAAGSVFRVAPGTMPLDHSSILKTIERRWQLKALTARDAAAQDIRRRADAGDRPHRRSLKGRGRADGETARLHRESAVAPATDPSPTGIAIADPGSSGARSSGNTSIADQQRLPRVYTATHRRVAPRPLLNFGGAESAGRPAFMPRPWPAVPSSALSNPKHAIRRHRPGPG
jgi:hypothetical protein